MPMHFYHLPPKFTPHAGADTMRSGDDDNVKVSVYYQSVTMMKEYRNWSPEELRYEEYNQISTDEPYHEERGSGSTFLDVVSFAGEAKRHGRVRGTFGEQPTTSSKVADGAKIFGSPFSSFSPVSKTKSATLFGSSPPKMFGNNPNRSSPAFGSCYNSFSEHNYTSRTSSADDKSRATFFSSSAPTFGQPSQDNSFKFSMFTNAQSHNPLGSIFGAKGRSAPAANTTRFGAKYNSEQASNFCATPTTSTITMATRALGTAFVFGQARPVASTTAFGFGMTRSKPSEVAPGKAQTTVVSSIQSPIVSVGADAATSNSKMDQSAADDVTVTGPTIHQQQPSWALYKTKDSSVWFFYDEDKRKPKTIPAKDEPNADSEVKQHKYKMIEVGKTSKSEVQVHPVEETGNKILQERIDARFSSLENQVKELSVKLDATLNRMETAEGKQKGAQSKEEERMIDGRLAARMDRLERVLNKVEQKLEKWADLDQTHGTWEDNYPSSASSASSTLNFLQDGRKSPVGSPSHRLKIVTDKIEEAEQLLVKAERQLERASLNEKPVSPQCRAPNSPAKAMDYCEGSKEEDEQPNSPTGSTSGDSCGWVQVKNEEEEKVEEEKISEDAKENRMQEEKDSFSD